jgi:hypothetical protein
MASVKATGPVTITASRRLTNSAQTKHCPTFSAVADARSADGDVLI